MLGVMRLHEFLAERILNLFTVADKQKYIDQVWDLLQTSYVNVGGFKSSPNKENLINTTGLWKLVRRGDEGITAVNIYKDQHGRKSVASGTNGTIQGKKDYILLKDADMRYHRAWVEASGPVERILEKRCEAIPNKYAAFLTGKEIISIDPDGYHYTRMIMGEPHVKKLFGFVELSPNSVKKLADFGIIVHELPKNFIVKSS